MISSTKELRAVAVKHIIRRQSGDYLLRHSLGMPWEESIAEDEMAWTDFQKLYFNFPKLNTQYQSTSSGELHDPYEHTVALLAALSHEMLHNLWLHKERSKGKNPQLWRNACEWAINYYLVPFYGQKWIDQLGVMYPPQNIIAIMRSENIPATTDGFYEVQERYPKMQIPVYGGCNFCERCRKHSPQDRTPEEMVRALQAIPESDTEKAAVAGFIANSRVAPQDIPWEHLMIGGIEDAVTQELSWARPSRHGTDLPSWRPEKLLSFVWIADVSPSIDDEMKRRFINTVEAGINLYQDALHRVIFFAEGVMQDTVIASGTNLSQIRIPYGSGTCLEEVWRILEKDQPEYALVLTDMELAPVPKPSVTHVIWGIIGEDSEWCFHPDYGTQVHLR